MKRLFFTFITAMTTLCLLLLSSCGRSGEQDRQIVLTTGFEEGELFFIGDSKCYVPEARLYVRALSSTYENKYGEELMSKQTGDTYVTDRLTGLALSRLAEVKAMGLLAADRGVTLSERDLERCDQAAERYIASLSDRDIEDTGIDLELLRTMYADYALADRVYDDITDDIDPEISDDEARSITIQRILIKRDDESEAMQTANTVYAMLDAGTSFDALVDDYNDASGSKYTFAKDTDMFSKEFIDACFELSTDEISSPIVTPEGVSIVKCISSFNAEDTDANKLRMVEKRKGEAFDEVYSAFVKDLYSSFNEELWEEQKLSRRRLDTDEDFFQVYEDVFSIL